MVFLVKPYVRDRIRIWNFQYDAVFIPSTRKGWYVIIISPFWRAILFLNCRFCFWRLYTWKYFFFVSLRSLNFGMVIWKYTFCRTKYAKNNCTANFFFLHPSCTRHEDLQANKIRQCSRNVCLNYFWHSMTLR